MNVLPLVVDLDGTLIRTDMLHESILKMLHNHILNVFCLFCWLFLGVAGFKQRITQHVTFDPSQLPYHQDLLTWLKQQKAAGRKLILCTAAYHTVAKSIADYVELFDEVIASDHGVNLKGKKKAEALIKKFGNRGFDYVGNAYADLSVWSHANNAIVVNASAHLAKKASTLCFVEHFFPAENQMKTLLPALRIHQWMKNVLLFVPLLAAHQFTNINAWIALGGAFLAFSLCASACYILNDLLDLENDRAHPRKRQRPFASGRASITTGMLMVPILLLVSTGLAYSVGHHFLLWLICYCIFTCAYSWHLKRLVLIDCFSLAFLYTLRVIAGAAATAITVSFWLLAFSIFLFFSLALIKRYAELETYRLNDKKTLPGRGYQMTDAPIIQIMGVAASYAAVLILVLYLNSEAILKYYRTPELVWGAACMVLFWIHWMWLQVHRGNMHDDPLVFAVKDKVSAIAGILFVAILCAATVGVPW